MSRRPEVARRSRSTDRRQTFRSNLLLHGNDLFNHDHVSQQQDTCHSTQQTPSSLNHTLSISDTDWFPEGIILDTRDAFDRFACKENQERMHEGGQPGLLPASRASRQASVRSALISTFSLAIDSPREEKRVVSSGQPRERNTDRQRRNVPPPYVPHLRLG